MRMKDGKILLTYARDLLVDEGCCSRGFKGRKNEEICDRLLQLEGSRCRGNDLPHLGASTKESEDNCAVMAVNEIRDFLENGNIRNSVNFPVHAIWSVCTGAGRVTICHKNIR